MIFENKDEENAFNFVCELAEEAVDKHGCNDLVEEDYNKFKNLIVEATEDGKQTVRKVSMDFDVLFWLRSQVKVNEDDKK